MRFFAEHITSGSPSYPSQERISTDFAIWNDGLVPAFLTAAASTLYLFSQLERPEDPSLLQQVALIPLGLGSMGVSTVGAGALLANFAFCTGGRVHKLKTIGATSALIVLSQSSEADAQTLNASYNDHAKAIHMQQFNENESLPSNIQYSSNIKDRSLIIDVKP